MRIGMIGAGFVSQNLAALAIARGHEVMLSNSRDPKTLFSAGATLGCRTGTAEEAAAFGDVVLVAVPLTAFDALPAPALAGKVVMDANNYYPQRDGQIGELDDHTETTSERLARHLPGARIVKAFNAIRAVELPRDAKAAGEAGRRALPIAGDDAEAKRVVMELTDELGYEPFDAGGLAESWRFERAKPAYCAALDRDGLKVALAAAERDVEVPDGSWRP
ncbi:NAD(P)-binding domain-containing protein [Aurantimonas sp. 22II-16-19i]|uniref:NADPH-dependent F420 reductase n=1 Tax=Aurantimonas sp. 22II-16-19i TaxID=1317114 RepID=UPI0009F7D797|nr:NAD(P)-binding domain-containing protein [Aurantimonas sp. 22II-16-19i]ORE96912.1 coenzyme F420-dependent NADP oxidoreductase [Aurantimonas sp. 22II-16-19i]